MAILVGYDQHIKHFNKKPELESNIYDLTRIAKSWYDPAAPKAKSELEILKRRAKYYFSVSTKAKTDAAAFRHSYYFDNEQEAKAEHQKLKVRLFDQLMEPFLKKLKHSKDLSVQDQLQLNAALSRIENLR